MQPTYAILVALAILTPTALRAEAPATQPATPATPPAAITKENVKPYPLDTCIVSGEKLGGMGTAVTFVHNGQEIKLCCKHCRKTFDKDPAKYLKKLEQK